MALQKIASSVRHQMYRMISSSARRCTNESEVSSPRFDERNPVRDDQASDDVEFQEKPSININEVFFTGTIYGEVLPTEGPYSNGASFLVDIMHSGRYGPFKVRTKVVAVGTALPREGVDALREGKKVLVKGRLGSKVDKSPDGTSVVRSTHVVGRHISLL